MEQPRTHDKRKTTKTMPTALNIGTGAGSFGIGGLVLLGGALVTATIVSVLAFKRRKQHQSSSNNDTKNVSTDNKDFSGDFSPLENPSMNGPTSMKQMETKTIQNLTKDEKHNSGIGNDEEVDPEGQEKASVYVDSVFENREVDNSYEKVVFECEEQVVMEIQIEDYSCLKKEDGGEEKKYSMIIIDNGNDELADAKSLVSDESVTSIEEYEAIEGVEVEERVVRDITTESTQDDVPSGKSHETVFMNEEAACANLVEVVDHHHMQLNEEEKYLSDETGYTDQIVYGVVIEEKAIDADCVRHNEVQYGPLLQLRDCEDAIIMKNCVGDLSKQCSSEQVMGEKETIKADCVDVVDMEDILEMAEHDVALDVQEKQVTKDRETFVITCITNRLKEAVDDQTTVKEDSPPSKSMNTEEEEKETEQKVEEQVTIKVELVNKKERVGTMSHVQLIEVAKVDYDQTVKREDEPPTQLVNEEAEKDITPVQVEVELEMITEGELVKKEGISKEDEIPHVESIEEDVKVRSNKSSDELEDSSMTPEPKISNHNNEENMKENQTILGREQNDIDQNGIIKEDKGNKSASNFLIELAKAKKQVLASEPWNLKLMTWSLLVSIWCLCHWYSELPYPKLSLVGSLFFVLILLGYPTTYLV